MEASKKLYAITSSDFKLVSFLDQGVNPVFTAANDIPQLFWPDGSVCWLANLYLIEGYHRGRSRLNKGGTLLTWAKHLSIFIRWCSSNQLDFLDLTDNYFILFVNSLSGEKHLRRPELRKRQDYQIGNICGTVLNFIEFLDRQFPHLNLVSENGTGKVKAKKETYTFNNKDGGTFERHGWTHPSVTKSREVRRRFPISSNAVELLYQAIHEGNEIAFIKRRRNAMLRLLEVTGGRRAEIRFLTVADIEKAYKTGELELRTVKKRRSDDIRVVPATKTALHDIKEFIDIYRNPLIKKLVKASKSQGKNFIEDDHVFVTVDGTWMETDTFTKELSILAKRAGIHDEEACLHAFRHRFITNVFRNLIREHHLRHKEDLNLLILSVEALKLKVLELTGHSSITSLDHYINLAFEAETGFQDALDIVRATEVISSVRKSVADYRRRMEDASAQSIRNVTQGIDRLLSDAEEDLREILRRQAERKNSKEKDSVYQDELREIIHHESR